MATSDYGVSPHPENGTYTQTCLRCGALIPYGTKARKPHDEFHNRLEALIKSYTKLIDISRRLAKELGQ